MIQQLGMLTMSEQQQEQLQQQQQYNNINIQEHCLTAIELDPVVIDIAQTYFNIKQTNTGTNKFYIICGNGLNVQATTVPTISEETTTTTTTTVHDTTQNTTKTSLSSIDPVHTVSSTDGTSNSNLDNSDNNCISIPEHSLSYIIIDVDSKDTTIGMSCPPIEFIDITYLRTLLQLLSMEVYDDDNENTTYEGHAHEKQNNDNVNNGLSSSAISGILAINVSARDPILLHTVCMNVAKVFSNVYISKKHKDWNQDAVDNNDDDVNKINDIDDENDDDDTDDTDDLNVVVFAQHHYNNIDNRTVSTLSASSSSSWLLHCTTKTLSLDERRQHFKSLFSTKTMDCTNNINNNNNNNTANTTDDSSNYNNNHKSIVLSDESPIIELASCLDTIIHWTPDLYNVAIDPNTSDGTFTTNKNSNKSHSKRNGNKKKKSNKKK